MPDVNARTGYRYQSAPHTRFDRPNIRRAIKRWLSRHSRSELITSAYIMTITAGVIGYIWSSYQ